MGNTAKYIIRSGREEEDAEHPAVRPILLPVAPNLAGGFTMATSKSQVQAAARSEAYEG